MGLRQWLAPFAPQPTGHLGVIGQAGDVSSVPLTGKIRHFSSPPSLTGNSRFLLDIYR